MPIAPDCEVPRRPMKYVSARLYAVVTKFEMTAGRHNARIRPRTGAPVIRRYCASAVARRGAVSPADADAASDTAPGADGDDGILCPCP